MEEWEVHPAAREENPVPDSEGKSKADAETVPPSPLHAYKVLSNDSDVQHPADIEDDDELELPHEKH